MDNSLKSISVTDDEFRVANYMILFGGRDVTGEYFTKDTEIDSPYTKSGMLHVDFEHGLDPDKLGISSDDVMGYIDWKTASIDDRGVFVERVLNRRAKYMEYIEPMIEAGLVGTSSEAIAGKTSRDEDGKITKWPLMRDSLTFMPAEPRMISSNAIYAAKSLHSQLPHIKSLARIADISAEESDIKSALDKADTLKEFEIILRDAKGFSRSEACKFVASLKSIVLRDAELKSSAVIADVSDMVKSSFSAIIRGEKK